MLLVTGISSISGLMYRSCSVYRRPALWLLVNICLFSAALLHCRGLAAQEQKTTSNGMAMQLLAGRGEVILRFPFPDSGGLEYLSSFLSIDNYLNDTVTAYANESGFRQFLELRIPYQVVSPPSLRYTGLAGRRTGSVFAFTRYPAYQEYISMMEGFASDFPHICRLTEFGTSKNGRKLLALKISDNPEDQEQEPVFFYSSTMHGDEVVGYMLMLRLIDYLLEGYGTDSRVKNLLDGLEIWINPLSNPDGTYFLSDTSVAGATRFNGNQKDLNRDFPDTRDELWDIRPREPETHAMMVFMSDIRPVLAANFHGGAEVVNYPWDTWERLHADNTWYRQIARRYADSAQYYGPVGYMTFLENGITNGYSWYTVYGGRQDYANYFLNGREVTIELSNEKMPDESTLEEFWNSNRRSLLQFMTEIFTGLSGTITDSITGAPVKATVSIAGHEKDNSFIYSSETDGSFYRLAGVGDHVLVIDAPGYMEKKLPAVASLGQLTGLNVKMAPVSPDGKLFPNPFAHSLSIYINEPGNNLVLDFIDLSGRRVKRIIQQVLHEGFQEIQVTGLAPGGYVVNINYGNQSMKQFVFKSGH
jgi:hypothetical protein